MAHEAPNPSSRRSSSGVSPRLTRLRAAGSRLLDSGIARYQGVRDRVPVVGLGDRALVRFLDIRGSLLSGYLAYRMFLLLLPLVAVIVAVAGFDSRAAGDTAEDLGLGGAVAAVIADAGEDAQRSRIPLLIAGLFGFAIAAWGFLGGLQFIAAQSWQLPTRRFPGRARAFIRLAGSLLLFGFILWVSALVRQAGVIAGLAGSLATLIGAFIGFVGLAWILPRRSGEWFWLLPGAAVGAGALALLQVVATFYLPEKLAGASRTYGAFGMTLTLLTYLFLLGLILTMVTVVDAVVWERYRGVPPGLLRQIAAKVHISARTFGSGYVEEGEVVETSVSPRLTDRKPGDGS